ncbi:Maltose ABC transporter permease protein [Spiroplasma clarkii]|uniref:hypothetical protein n=1 Tax=Spiroplasma clarkii TaxID=2139 RepID=UPI000B57F314|nr:hypothetical protein [Spiroplasma clarkii]ARU90942.1 Maltose ABC transporter permease protein [Spiroplasma clarkii]
MSIWIKQKCKSIFSYETITISEASKWQNNLISEIESEFKNEKSSIYVRYIRFMTETYGKLYLSDKPPMTTSQKLD